MSGGSLAGPETSSRCKTVTVKHPESNKPKPTTKKNKPIQADLDVTKEFTKCKEDGLQRLDLSKSSVRFSIILFVWSYRHFIVPFIDNAHSIVRERLNSLSGAVLVWK